MQAPIPRGRIAHRLHEDIAWFARAASAKLTDSKLITEFENEFSGYVDRRHAVAFPFARTGIHAVLESLDLPPGSIVLMPPITIKPILDVVLSLNLKPLFVDINESTVCFDESALREATKSSPRVAILTYLFGIVPNVENICKILSDAGVFIIEDFSQCLNGTFRGRRIGTFGDVGVYSASSVKTLDTYGGGLVVTDDDTIAIKLRTAQSQLSRPSRLRLLKKIFTDLIRNLVTQPLVFSLATFPLIRLLTKHGNSEVIKFTGDRNKSPLQQLPQEWFEQFTSVQAAVGFQQLKQLHEKDERRIAAVEEINTLHNFADRPIGDDGGKNVYWQFIVYADEFARFQRELFAQGVDCATTSLVKISGLEQYPHQGTTPNADRLYAKGVYLPCYYQLTKSQVARIGQALARLDSKR